MSEPILYIDHSEIVEGKLEQLKAAIKQLAEFVDANEPRVFSYNAYLSENGTRITVVHIHPDSASLELHMKMAGPAFRRFTEFVNLSMIEIYGKPSDNLLKLLQQKAQMLGNGTVVVHELHAGFARFEALEA